MNQTTEGPQRVAVVGGGITGLAAAHRMVELAPHLDVQLLEASERVGGALRTVQQAGFLVEQSADMFTTKDPWALDLCSRIGFDDQLMPTNESQRRAFVVHRGRLARVPAGFTLMSPTRIWPMLTTPLLTWRGKARLACEYLLPRRRDQSDESLAEFTRRRMGREAFERIVQPMIGGIYTADSEKLSMQATMRQFVELERQYGSVIRGMRHSARQTQESRQASGARYGAFLAPKEGMSSLVAAVADRLPAGSIRLQTPINQISRNAGGQYQVRLQKTTETYDGVILAVSAGQSAGLLKETCRPLAEQLSSVQAASSTVVVLGYRRSQVAHPLDGFGFVVPLAERRRILAGSFASIKFPGRAPQDHVLLRVFVGGACQPELADLDDSDTLDLVKSELSELIGTTGQPELTSIVRWRNAMPQYHLGHRDLVDRIECLVAELPNLQLAGNSYHGVGIPFCVRSGEQAAERLIDSLARN